MESLALSLFGGCYAGRRVLVTGHTGFKGSWLALWLTHLGARVSGIALDPDTPHSHWEKLALPIDDRRHDIRDGAGLRRLVESMAPEIVFHLAAQPLVRRSYAEPVDTWSTNVIGTVHVLEACRHAASVRAVVAVTSDKVYENRAAASAYREEDRLGGHDPYSASKAASELAVDSYRSAFFSGPRRPLVASARAGNVIGGGDWSPDRLVPDAARSLQAGRPMIVRSPGAIRPWQHVLESLSGYLTLGQRLLQGDEACATAWNFGPDARGAVTVEEVLKLLQRHWPELRWDAARDAGPHEAAVLHVDSGKAQRLLGWRPLWSVEQAAGSAAAWYRAWFERQHILSQEQLGAYIEAARAAGSVWTRP